MTDFEEILEELMPSGVKFYWGNSDDIPRFLKVYGEKHFPFIWSVPKEDSESDHGGHERDAELNICTRETRELLNPARLAVDKSYKSILYPAWEGLKRNIRLSENMEIVEDSISFQKFPEFSTNGENDNAEVWDVLKVSFKARFFENYNC